MHSQYLHLVWPLRLSGAAVEHNDVILALALQFTSFKSWLFGIDCTAFLLYKKKYHLSYKKVSFFVLKLYDAALHQLW